MEEKVICEDVVSNFSRLRLLIVIVCRVKGRQTARERVKLIGHTGTVFLSTQLHCEAIITVRTTNQLESIKLSHMIYFSAPKQHNCLHERKRSG